MQEQTIESPCIDVCKLDASRQYCIGCHRTLQEIGEWSKATDGRKREIISAAQARR